MLRAAELLGGEPLLPEIDHVTPNAGIVRFRDSDGHDRVLDVITVPYGLAKRDVVRRAVRVRYQPPRSQAVHFWVMNPVHCMQSRVHNGIGLRQRDRHGLRQLRVSIPCAREFLRSLLDQEEVDITQPRRRVMAWNQRILAAVAPSASASVAPNSQDAEVRDLKTSSRSLATEPMSNTPAEADAKTERHRRPGNRAVPLAWRNSAREREQSTRRDSMNDPTSSAEESQPRDEGELLFNAGELSAALEVAKETLREEIQVAPEDYLLNVDPDEWVAHLAEKHRRTPLALQREEMYIEDLGEEQVDVRYDHGRAIFDTSTPTYVTTPGPRHR